MSAIPCSSVSLKTMADGTLRISFDIEPMHAQDAFRLFASPGTPAAIAALQVGYEAKSDMGNPITEKPKGGPLSKLAGIWCNDPEFWAWACKFPNAEPFLQIDSQDAAATFIKTVCGIQSRAELDNDKYAEHEFHQLIRGPYSKHLIARGIVS